MQKPKVGADAAMWDVRHGVPARQPLPTDAAARARGAGEARVELSAYSRFTVYPSQVASPVSKVAMSKEMF